MRGVDARSHLTLAKPGLVSEPAPGLAQELIEPLLTAAEVARILAVRPKRVYELGIPSVRLSEKCLRWRRSVVLAWLEARTEGGPQ
jgi:hypothetical protein